MGASMTASSSTLGMLLLLFAACSCIHATEPKDDGDLVAKVCAKATSDFCHIHLTKKYCMSTLRKDTRSVRAKDARGLALVAIDLARRGATAADAKAAAALERKSSEDAKRGLRYCRSDFAAVERLTALCRDEVESYKDKDGARDVMEMYYNTECAAKLVSVGENCGHYSWFLGHEFGEALRKEFVDVARRTALVKAMVEAMIGMEDPVAGFDDEWDDDE